MTPLTWPGGLSDTTPMPYRVWRVMHHVDGTRPAGEVARLAHTTLADVQACVDEAQRWVGQAVRREQQVGDATARVVTQCLAAAVGPLASVMVDEVLDDLGQHATLSALLASLAAQLTPDRAQLFARQLRERGMA
ncbi:hypothetical protein HNQ07_000085 [Deinococcus metalli]|uniref:DUF8082 domain-containing protein n=1 Tax=Deinococcus metalli TaxID=1141878 RepID=A0A7W8KCR6_9DEIO|nr:hypothetical protein [Deinococcus metalli]MBB5374641.1 hypothetical protein [Deinococcus metalli]GHF34801.1 hypothetical protein GCM10017781_09560 [Deinococcus metalli]